MEKINLKLSAVIIILVFVSLPIFTSSLLDFEQGKINEENYQRLLKEAQAEKDGAEKALLKIYLMGKFDPAQASNFVAVPAELATVPNKMYLRKETLDAFSEMREAADKDEVDLKIASATRNFDYQKKLWNDKWTGATLVDGKNLSKSMLGGLNRFKKILEYSAVPGISRHHWGTDIDINDANVEYFETESGEKVYNWLTKNAPTFGFCQPYTQKGAGRPTGYNEEKWHWSYAPLSRVFIEQYKNLITDADIKGFDGDKYVSNLNLINDYVSSVNPDCL